MQHSKKDLDSHPHHHADRSPHSYTRFMRFFFGRSYRKLAKLIDLKEGERLLDVGCGPGVLLGFIHQKYLQNALVGLDVDADRLKMAKENLPSLTFHQSSATSIPEPDESFDAVTATLMLHHLKSEDKKKMLKEVYRVLKPGGHFYLFDFCKPTGIFGKWFVRLFRVIENKEEALAGKYKNDLKEASFTQIEAGYRAYGVIELLTAIKP